jgi:predicted ATPase/DNA-binding winged helix-turn-helix (wHTH) protein
MSDSVVAFEGMELDLDAFELRRDGTPISLEPQVFSLLTYLVQNRDRLITKDELLDELWGHRFVSESALATQVKSLRKAVGDDGRSQRVIKTIHGRGYRFVAEILAAQAGEAETTRVSMSPTQALHNLPRERSPLFGREEDVARCQELLEDNRLVSILGIGGTGKTRLSVAVGRSLTDEYPDGVWFIDLIPVVQSEAIDDAIANATRLALADGDSRRQVCDTYRDSKMLVILDNCEHIKEEVAQAMDYFLDHTDAPQFLVTSRDPINLPDEHRYFLEPLSTERGAVGVSAAEMLFVTTAERHGVRGTRGEDEDAKAIIQQVCRQLDGLPLAIELAAAQLRYLTLKELAGRLDRRFQVLEGGPGSSSARQSNLSAVLTDTWKLLTDDEQTLLSQLSAFPGQFTMADAEEMVDPALVPSLPRAMSRLVELCLLNRGSGAWWRLLETVRQFATNQLDEEASQAYAIQHAEWCKRRLGDFPEDHLDNLSQASWCLAHYDDLETAETIFDRAGRLEDAMFVCTSTGLMIQLDDGARAKSTLERARSYLSRTDDDFWRARLHAIAGLAAQGNRSPDTLMHHTDECLELARKIENPALLSTALVMKSLTTVFTDGDLAHRQIDEAIELGQKAGSPSTAMSAKCYRAWHMAIQRKYEEAIAVASEIVDEGSETDNPVYNAIAALVSCLVMREPDQALRWSQKFADFPAVASFWVIQLLLASVAAVSGAHQQCAAYCLEVRGKLRRANRDEFPDVAIPAALLASRVGETEMAQRWLKAIRDNGATIQTYHMIVVYRNLYEAVGFTEEDSPDLALIRAEIGEFLERVASDQ